MLNNTKNIPLYYMQAKLFNWHWFCRNTQELEQLYKCLAYKPLCKDNYEVVYNVIYKENKDPIGLACAIAF